MFNYRLLNFVVAFVPLVQAVLDIYRSQFTVYRCDRSSKTSLILRAYTSYSGQFKEVNLFGRRRVPFASSSCVWYSYSFEWNVACLNRPNEMYSTKQINFYLLTGCLKLFVQCVLKKAWPDARPETRNCCQYKS